MKIHWPWAFVGKPKQFVIDQMRKAFGDLEPKYRITQPADNRKQYHIVERWKKEGPSCER